MRTVVQVIPRDDFKVYIYFSDGHIKLYDASKLIAKGGIARQIADIESFKNKCTVMNQTLAWDLSGDFDESKCLDLDPENLYAESTSVDDPLGEKAG